MELFKKTAMDAACAIRAGEISSRELVQACLDRIADTEATVQAWAHLDPEHALEQARQADARQAAGEPLGPLHGVPVGVKDIFDTCDMPTEDGTVLHAGRTPAVDAKAVSLLRAAGTIVMGKTVTTELAVYAPGKTRNPCDPERTPGGSSSGSAAAVSAHMVPLAIGTQTNGSIIRPASYCGVCGFKPSHGLISRTRVLKQSRVLDQIGVFARTVEDAALLAGQLVAYDEHDPDTELRAHSNFLEATLSQPPVAPDLAFVKTPVWDEAEAVAQEAFAELVDHLEDRITETALPAGFADAISWHRTIMETDMARSFEREYASAKDSLSATLREMIERGQTHRAVDYNQAVEEIAVLNRLLDHVFERYDAIVTPATTGEAPAGLDSTGNPIFCTLWTLCGVPTISLPLLQGASGLPIGVQLVGPKGDDARLLRTARWLVGQVSE